MGRKTGSCVVFLFFLAHVISQENSTTVSTDEVVLQSGICRKCTCDGQIVNCSAENLTTFFSASDWEALAPLKPTHIDLSDNSFLNITAMANLPVQVLNLSHCNVEFIEYSSFRDLQDMVTLDLSYNSLTYDKLSPHAFEGRYSPEQYEPLRSMRKLNLAYNKLHALNQDLFEHMPDLTELDLSGNPLGTPDLVTMFAISSVHNLRVLRMRECQMEKVPERFLHTLNKMERFDISYNKLRAVPRELAETKSLVYLNLNQNPIERIEAGSEDFPPFPTLRNLKELHMCNMPELVSLGNGALGGLQNLARLHLSFNEKLSTIHPKALARPDDIGESFVYVKLTHLYLQSNNLSMLESRMMPSWDHLDDIDVSNNPWVCDCTTQWMVNDLVTIIERIHPNASLEMACQQPIEMKEYNMKQLHDVHRNMRCLDKYGHRPERDGAILLGTLIGVLLAVPIMLALVLMWRQGYFGWMGLRGPSTMSRAFYKRAPVEDNYI